MISYVIIWESKTKKTKKNPTHFLYLVKTAMPTAAIILENRLGDYHVIITSKSNHSACKNFNNHLYNHTHRDRRERLVFWRIQSSRHVPIAHLKFRFNSVFWN